MTEAEYKAVEVHLWLEGADIMLNTWAGKERTKVRRALSCVLEANEK